VQGLLPTGWTNFCCGTLKLKANQKKCFVWPYGVAAANVTLLKNYNTLMSSLDAATRACIATYGVDGNAWALWNNSMYANYTAQNVSNVAVGARRLLQVPVRRAPRFSCS
jgi:hypothetical protein